MASTQAYRSNNGMSDATASHDAAGNLEKVKDTATSVYETAKEKASDVFDVAKSTASDALETAKSAGLAAYGEGKDAAKSIAANAGEAFSSTLEEQKTAGANAVAKAAQSAREAAEGLEKDAPQIAGIIKTAASSVEDFSNSVKDKTVTELMDSVTDFAKQRPMAFLACGMVAGMLVSRMLSGSNRA